MKLTLLVADRKINALTEAFDMRSKDKVFVTRVEQEFELPASPDTYIMNLIEKSRKEKDFWIPGIVHKGVLYCAKEIKQLCDGRRTMINRRQRY